MNFTEEINNTQSTLADNSSNLKTSQSKGNTMTNETNLSETTSSTAIGTIPEMNLSNIFNQPLVDGKFISNNWLESPKNKTLQALDKHSIAVWLNTDGDYSCRMSPTGEINKMTPSKLKKVVSSKLKKSIIISEDDDADIKAYDLLLVSEDVFDPQRKTEFFEEKREIYRNRFAPTSYMELALSKDIVSPKAINGLIEHLVKGNKNYEKWLINWLAYFFQGLVKSPVALFLKGPQGAGKGVFYDDILVPLFGTRQCIQVNDKTMKGDFLGGIVEGKLVMNLDEISSGIQNNKEFKNQLKALISNRGGTFQKKFVNTEKETLLHAMILITSNEAKALEVEPKDRRLTIFNTSCNISEVNFLGYGSYKALIDAIQSELEDFARTLLTYEVDVKMATTAIHTPEKEALVGVSTTRYKSFAIALKSKDIDFFVDLEDDMMYKAYHADLLECFRKNRLSRKLLKKVFAKLYGDITTNKLMEELRAIDPAFFNEDDNSVKANNGDFLFRLNSEHNDYFTVTPIIADSFAPLNNDIDASPLPSPVTGGYVHTNAS